MLSDIEIAQQAKLLPITEVASKLNIEADELELYGKYKAKLSDELSKRIAVTLTANLYLLRQLILPPPVRAKQQ